MYEYRNLGKLTPKNLISPSLKISPNQKQLIGYYKIRNGPEHGLFAAGLWILQNHLIYSYYSLWCQ